MQYFQDSEKLSSYCEWRLKPKDMFNYFKITQPRCSLKLNNWGCLILVVSDLNFLLLRVCYHKFRDPIKKWILLHQVLIFWYRLFWLMTNRKRKCKRGNLHSRNYIIEFQTSQNHRFEIFKICFRRTQSRYKIDKNTPYSKSDLRTRDFLHSYNEFLSQNWNSNSHRS